MSREKKQKTDILDINIKKAFKYQAAAFSGAFMHFTFMVLFFVMKLYILAIFNIFSVSFYILMGAVCEKKNFERSALRWIAAMFLEVNAHSTLCTVFLGWEWCFFLYSMMTIPVVIYYLFLTCGKTVFKRGTLLFTVLSLLFLAGSLIYLHFNVPIYYVINGPVFDADARWQELMLSVNVFYNMLLLFGFSCLFILEIHSLINKLNQTNEQLNYTATHDALTGLYNRHCLSGKLDELENSSEPFCLAMGDLDDFKKINDTYGHECGDIVLKSVAEIIMRNIGENDIACRWGGEEMLIIMSGSTEECYSIVSRIRSEINDLDLEYENRSVKVSMTFGFAGSAEDDTLQKEGIDAFISIVDKRLYKGKTGGKNVVVTA